MNHKQKRLQLITALFASTWLTTVNAEVQTPADSNEPSAHRHTAGTDVKSAAKIKVKKIILKDCNALPKQLVDDLLKGYENKTVTMEALQALRQKLSMMYLANHFVNSGVIIPDQKIKDGIIYFQAIEGQLNKISVSGNKHINSQYIEDRIALGSTQPLNVEKLEDAIRQLQNNRLIEGVYAQLKPLPAYGTAELAVTVSEAKDRTLRLSIDNERSPTVGAEQATVTLLDANLTGHGDTIQLDFSRSEGLRAVELDYQYPVTADGQNFAINLRYNDAEVVEEPIDRLNITSETLSADLSYSWPLNPTIHSSFEKLKTPPWQIIAGFSHKDSSSFLFGEPFAFAGGTVDGESKSTALSVGLQYLSRDAKQVTALSLNLRQGIDWLGATTEPQDSRFMAFSSQLQYAKRLPKLRQSQFIFSAATQQSFDPLLPIEKFAIGGHSTIRGYRENQLVRDNGLTASFALQIPLHFEKNKSATSNQKQTKKQKQETPFTITGIELPGEFSIEPFLDWGLAWDEPSATQTDNSFEILSAGLGFRWIPSPSLALALHWAEPLESKVSSQSNGDLQDDGFHFYVIFQQDF